ncbi:6-phosphogluconolactonase (cycloisomerase 2 family) [Nocardioides cavernae]|uniref:6-phosphogluconolactonase (Cycloisomerase 2 family) n=1 Tax=Nocardioides cavernae TaxID=1921566 RepID=A0A7Y9GZT2_9ACTN|nr:lactonase family protein [Nocardioides cavernae]NYE35362.1 6-phosphogluconolactonase (cycloisomerase 2 family) [Nocardioides cavernae]
MSHPSSTRRSVLVGAAAAGAGIAGTAATASAAVPRARHPRRDLIAYVGSRTTRQRNARGAGITVWRVPAGHGGPWELLQTVTADDNDPTTPTPADAVPVNPSFVVLSDDQRFLYAVHGDSTKVSAFAVDPRSGTLSLLDTVDCGRPNPVHLAIDPSGRWLVVAFLTAPGAVLVLPRNADGSLGAVTSTLELPGTPGPHKTQQLGPNPHHVVFDPTGRWLAVADRGVDRVFVAALDATTGALSLNDPGWAQVREIEGPRHIAFHPHRPHAYLVNELRSTVTTFDWNSSAGTLEATQVVPSHAPTFVGDTRGAEIAVSPSGRYVYASNRSGAGDNTPGGPDPDTIGVFEVRRSGHLEPVGWVSTEGIRPRFFGVDPTGHRLFVANEVTDTVVGFSLDGGGRVLRRMGVVARTASPTTIAWRG